MEAIILPVTHVDVFIGELIDSTSMFAVCELANVLCSIFVVDFFELRFDFSALVEELSQELLFAVGLGFHAGVRHTDPVGVVASYHHLSNIQLFFKIAINSFVKSST